MIYLCSPYSSGKGVDPDVRQRRYELVRNFIAYNADKNIYSPIVHWHDAAIVGDLPKDFAFWQAKARDMIRRCDQVWILDVMNEEDWEWDTSEGVKEEGSFAMNCGIPVNRVPFYTPDREIPEDIKEELDELLKQKQEGVDGKPH